MDTPFNDDDEAFGDIGSLGGGMAGVPGGRPGSPTGPLNSPGTTSGIGNAVLGSTSGDEAKSSVITARGTSEGLVLRIDGRVEPTDLRTAVREFLTSRRSFLSGNDVAFEWIGKKPEDALVQELAGILTSEFDIAVRGSRIKTPAAKAPEAVEPAAQSTAYAATPLSVVGGTRSAATKPIGNAVEKTVSLFDGIEGLDSRATSGNAMLWDDPDCRIIYGTLRSGQKVETEHSVVVFGDVNSGAEVIAGGDIVILGTLRGIAHAGAYDESGGGRVIFSLNLQPTQLRIGLVISRGSGPAERGWNPERNSSDRGSLERGEAGRSGVAEVARVENHMIVVEPYQSRTVWVRRRE